MAKHETAEECQEIFQKLLRKVQAKQKAHPIWRNEDTLYFTHDNATFFTAAELPPGEGEVYEVIRMPSHSPDIHKIVEHPIHPIKAAFRRRFTQMHHKTSHERAMALLDECPQECVSRQSVEKDCLTVNDTLRSILRNGGDWADKSLR